MDMSELASKMLQWEQRKQELDALENEIKAAVLEVGKTQTVGNVRATYTNGRTTYDYQTGGANAPSDIIARNSEVVINWKAVCEAAGIEAPVKSKTDPSVSIKLLS